MMNKVFHPALMDSDYNKAALDTDRPIMFIDVDGCLNPIPYERRWIGPEDVGIYDPELWNPKNWAWDKLECDPLRHYPITSEFEATPDSWLAESSASQRTRAEIPESKHSRKVTISLAEEMVAELKSLIKLGNFQVVYLTWWRSEALRLIEPEFKLGGNSFLMWRPGNRGHMMKIWALRELYDELNLRNPFVVIDDESLEGREEGENLWHSSDGESPKLSQKKMELNAVPKLYLKPDSRWGIDRNHMSRLSSFVEKLNER